MTELYMMDIRRVALKYALATEKIRTVYPERLRKISRFARAEDRLRSLASSLLLYETLGASKILYEERGKPYVVGGPHFNLSHSGDYALLAIDDGPVGVDVEKWEPWFKSEWRTLSRLTFHKDERAVLAEGDAQKNSVPSAKSFFDLWTLKESYMKMLGTGLSLNPTSFAVKIESSRACIDTDSRARLFLYPLEGYSVSLCSLSDGPSAIQEVVPYL
jgi:4'-phosphopantetheinyl transferase